MTAPADGGKSPEEIEAEIARTREHLTATLDALERQIAPRHLMEKGAEMLKDSIKGNLDTRGLGETLRENPIPIALIGIGLGWLMLSNVPAARGAAQRYGRAAREGVTDAVSGATERVKGATGRVKDWVGARPEYEARSGAYARTKSAGTGFWQSENEHPMAGATNQAGGEPDDLQSRADRARRRAAEALGGAAASARDALAGAAGAAGDAASRAASAARAAGDYAGQAYGRAEEVAAQAGDYAVRAKDRFAQVIDDHPLAVGALGFLAGAVIAAALPSTRAEDEFLGETRDDLLREAQGVGREAWERAQEAASSAATAAVDAAKDATREAVAGTPGEAGKIEPATGTAAAGSAGTIDSAASEKDPTGKA
jgi:hypothetical protein